MGRSLLLRPPFSFSLLIQVLFFFSQNASQRKQGKLNMQTLIAGYFVVQFTGGGDFQSLKQEVVVADPGLFLIPQFYRSTYLRSEEHTSELQSRPHLVCRLLLEKKKITNRGPTH